MARILTTVREVVDALGGVPAVAHEFQVVESAVWNWVSAGAFPAKTYCAMHEMLADVSAAAPDDLWTMAKRSKPRRQTEMAA